MVDFDFGERLKELRKKAGLTQSQLGERVGLTKSVISFYEQQERSPSPAVIVRLSEIFHVSTDYLLDVERGRTLDISDLTKEQAEILEDLAAAMRARNK